MRFIVAVVLVLGASVADRADAGIPAFARRYRLPCGSCHDPIPRLTAFGEYFLENGYAIAPGDTTGTTANGDSLLVLSQVLPLAIRFDAYVRYVSGQGGRSDFQTPYAVKLLSGGVVARNISYYLYLMLSEDGTTGSLEDANVTFNEVLGTPVSLTVGQFQIIDPIWKRELRVTVADYEILRHRPGNSLANLTYDRGLLASFRPTTSTGLFAAVVNGNGIGEAQGGSFDSDRPKAGMLAITQNFGPLRLSLFGYTGTQRLDTGTGTIGNRTRMAGPGVFYRAGPVDVAAQYVYRDDRDPAFTGVPTDAVTRGGFAEVSWYPRGRGGRLLLTALYNAVESSDFADAESATLNVSWLQARNLRLAAEGTWDLVGERGDLKLGLVTAF